MHQLNPSTKTNSKPHPTPQVPAGKLECLTLKLSVIDAGRVGAGRQLLGHVLLPLSELEGDADEEPQLYKLDIEKVSASAVGNRV